MDKYVTKKATKIKAILTDVDGVLTDGKLYYDKDGEITKTFSVKDGQLIKFFKEKGFKIGFISGRADKCVLNRSKHLKIDYYAGGSKDKIKDLEKFIDMFNISIEEICYIGDDLIDLGVLKKVGLSICPIDAIDIVKDNVDYVSQLKGGEGVLRNAIDIILKSQDLYIELLNKKEII
jgi:3-deoxy-D-manno-octulosonate 8-phosphate phosphatase (KDO 8-P phosphatase)